MNKKKEAVVLKKIPTLFVRNFIDNHQFVLTREVKWECKNCCVKSIY